MVCDHTDRYICLVIDTISNTSNLTDFITDCFDRVYIKDRIYFLYYNSKTWKITRNRSSVLNRYQKIVIRESKDGYPELEEKAEFIFNHLSQEEKQFNKTIDQGLSILADMEKDMNEKGSKELAGADAFKLYDTYGYPSLDSRITI